MNKLRTMITALLLAVALMPAAAQNSIDRMMENYSSRGSSRYTSAVERDPATRQVKRVVNVLELHYFGIDEFISAFRREAQTGNFTEKRDEDGLTLMLTVRGTRQNRIYMLRCTELYAYGRRDSRYNNAKVTVIVKYK